jgi:hypothetical protein
MNRKLKMNILRLAAGCGVIAAATFLAAGSDAPQVQAQATQDEQAHAAHGRSAPAKLVQAVRDATMQYSDVKAATAAGYQPFLGCVSGPDHGAMGVHYVNGTLVGDGEIDAAHPEALIYEPGENGAMQLVGVEYIVDMAAWLAKHSSPPVLEGQTFQLVGSPNRYGLAPFFELHVWAWRHNPNGAFVDWNTHVTCEGQ